MGCTRSVAVRSFTVILYSTLGVIPEGLHGHIPSSILVEWSQGAARRDEGIMAIISATHWARVGGGFEAVETRTFGNERTARMWAAEVLGTIVTTNGCYWRDLGRAGDVELTRLYNAKLKYSFTRGRCSTKRGQCLPRVHPQVVIVPSVGELGYW